jgi:hypothetical protein
MIVLAGVVVGAVIVVEWINHGFGSLADENLAVLAATLIIVGIQVFFSSFLISILGLRRRDGPSRNITQLPPVEGSPAEPGG